MQITSTQRFLDENGNPIEEYELSGSRYSTIAVRKHDDGVEIRALDASTGEVTTLEASLLRTALKGLELEDGRRPRDIDEDLRSILHQQRFAFVDTEVVS